MKEVEIKGTPQFYYYWESLLATFMTKKTSVTDHKTNNVGQAMDNISTLCRTKHISSSTSVFIHHRHPGPWHGLSVAPSSSCSESAPPPSKSWGLVCSLPLGWTPHPHPCRCSSPKSGQGAHTLATARHCVIETTINDSLPASPNKIKVKEIKA